MDSSEGFFEVTSYSEQEVSTIAVDDMQLGVNAGYGMLAMGVALLVSFGVSWIISLFRRT